MDGLGPDDGADREAQGVLRSPSIEMEQVELVILALQGLPREHTPITLDELSQVVTLEATNRTERRPGSLSSAVSTPVERDI